MVGQFNLLDKGEFIQIDYVKNAESVGLKAWLSEDESAFKQAFLNARDETGLCMIVVLTENYCSNPGSEVWWEVVGAEVTNDPDTKALVDAREVGRAKQRFYY